MLSVCGTGKRLRNLLTFHPLTPNRWGDFEKLFGEKGACGGCWCMWWRTKQSDFEKRKGDGNRIAMKSLVVSGTVPGILVYDEKDPVGWCSVAPREQFSRLKRSRILKPIDEEPVWSVVCFFIRKAYRRQGLTVRLLESVVNYVREQGGEIVEGYPVDPRKGNYPDTFAYTGLMSAFQQAQFKEAARRSETRPIMRRWIQVC